MKECFVLKELMSENNNNNKKTTSEKEIRRLF